ncbi:MAG: hypothetical protein V3T84_05805 [Phycisphaerales bacterium]
MQALQRIIDNIVTQMKGLPPTARLLIGSLMAIVVLSLFLVAQLTGQPSMLPLPVTLADEGARARAIAYLDSAAIPHEQRGSELFVPSEQRFAIVAKLLDADAMSPDQINFDKLIEQDSPFLTRQQHDRRWLIAKMNVLGRMISGLRGIQQATVVIDPSSRGGLGRTSVPPTASVIVFTRGGPLSQAQVEAIAQLVAGSEAALDVTNVAIIDGTTGRSHKARDEDDVTAGIYLERKLALEKEVKSTLLTALEYIPGVRVAVNVMVNATSQSTRIDKYQEPVSAPTSESIESESETNQRQAGEPGVRSNIGVEIASIGPIGSDRTLDRSVSELEPRFPSERRLEQDPKGYALKINSTVLIPRSYFIGMYQQDQNDPTAVPDAAQLQAVEDTEIARIKSDIEPMIDTGPFDDAVPGVVVVSSYPDFAMPPPLVPGGVEVVPESWTGTMVGGPMVRYVGLGSLAFISLAMMFLMVRKASVREALPSPAEIVGLPPALEVDDLDLVGEAEESALALEGVELDDTELRRGQLLEQINETIKTSPEEAASLVRRWAKAEG